MKEKKAWHITSPLPNQQPSLQENPQLFEAGEEERTKVLDIYNHHTPVPGYGITGLKVIYYPHANRMFQGELEKLQARKGKPVFEPNWESMSNSGLRKKVMGTWEKLSQPYTDSSYPNVRLLPTWHGTHPDAINSILTAGYANLATTDAGFFGKGLYSSYEAEYAHRVYSKGALIMNWVASFSPLPVVEGDMASLKGMSNYGNYDAHFIPVFPQDPDNPNETVYYPCTSEQEARYHELVVFQANAMVPRYLVQLENQLLQQLPLLTGMMGGKKQDATKTQPTQPASFSSGLNADYSTSSEFNKPQAPSTSTTTSADYSAASEWKPDEKKYQEVQTEGQEAIKQGNYRQGVSKLSMFLATKPAFPLLANLSSAWAYEHVIYPKTLENTQKAKAYYAEAYLRRNELIERYTQEATLEVTYALGLLYAYAEEALQERHLAEPYFKKGAQQEHAQSQRELGLLYQLGKGVTKNDNYALLCFQAAAKGGDAKAMYHLALCYEQGLEGLLPKDEAQAFTWYEKAAEKGDVLAQNNLALSYEQKNNYLQAAHYYRLAADQGYPIAQCNLGIIYENGRPGVAKDQIKAAQYYHAAVAQQFSRAQNNLAGFFERGLGGMPQDFQRAFELYKAAADQGYARARFNLGLCYEEGRGTDKNLQQAKACYELAAANPNERIYPEAVKKLAELNKAIANAPTPFWSQPNTAKANIPPTANPTTPFGKPF
jgi:TPR repeat protein